MFYSRFVFFQAERKTEITILANTSIGVEHGTQMHDMWPFGPLVWLGVIDEGSIPEVRILV